ncbi:MAG TPA: hypothetical protein VKP65_13860 [Rhodothermales bacterium]|nr:hypothetical protein [Rhodothermales bacterium]
MTTFNYSTSLRLAWTTILALLLLLLIAPPAAAGPAEEAKFPDGYDDLKDEFEPYFSTSTSTLRNLDSWTEGKVDNYDENNWEKACSDVLGKLHQAYRNALDTHQETNDDADELPDEVMDWYEDEVKAWNNVSSIGYDLIGLHDDLVDLTNAIDTEYLREAESARTNAKSLATTLEKSIKLLASLAGTPLPSMPSGLPPEMQEQYDKEVSPTAMALQQLLVKVQGDVKRMTDRVEREKYDARLSTLQNKDIDPDQSGVFVKHERTWEGNLRKALTTFEKTYDSYVDTAQPIYEGTMVVRVQGLKAYGYEYARAAAEYFEDLKKQYMRSVEDLGPPMASIDRVSIRDFREVKARQNARVTIKNTGKITLQPDEWVLTCSIEEHPKHYRPSSKDFACEETLDEELPPGRTHTFSLPFTAPEAAGEWELKWELKHQGDLTDSATEEFMILGEVHAEIDRVKIDGRTSPRLTAGRNAKIEVTVENTGTEFLFKNRCELVASVEESPRDYKVQRKDFSFEITLRSDVPPGETYTFKETVEVPEGIGDWELQFEFKANRKTLDTATIEVEVEE